jgi:hypothetical protein
VAYLGDSVGTGILNNGLQGALGGVGCSLAFRGGFPGMAMAEGAQALRGAAAVPANVAVVVIGYHNTRSEVLHGRFAVLVDAVVQAAGERLVVWPLLGRTPDCSAAYSDAVARADEQLQAATARWPNLVVADYPAFIAAHPEFAVKDCPHLLPKGYAAAGAWLAGEVRRVLDARGGRPA